MNEYTEAHQLLQGGNLFTQRVGLQDAQGSLIFVGVKAGALSIYFGDDPIIHADLEGRWQRVYQREVDTHFVKSLDGAVVAIARRREGPNLVLHRDRLTFAKVVDLDEWVRLRVLALLGELASGRFTIRLPAPGAAILEEQQFIDLLERVARWDPSAWFRNREGYRQAYRPDTALFLPPTCAQAIVLQATAATQSLWLFDKRESGVETFTTEQFKKHSQDVSRFLGRRAAQSRGIVLAGADALAQPTEQVLAWIEAAASTFELGVPNQKKSKRDPESLSLEGVFGFANRLSGRTGAEWSALASKGLHHVDLGIVSANQNVSECHGMDPVADTLVLEAERLKQAGLQVGIVLVGGCGGREAQAAHEAETIALIRKLPLGKGDIVYLVDLDEPNFLLFREELARRGVSALDQADSAAQLRRLRDAFLPMRAQGVKVVPYALAKQARLD